MKTEEILIPAMTLEEFAEKNDLTLVIHEVIPTPMETESTFKVHFDNVGRASNFPFNPLTDGLSKCFGEGNSKEEAISNYVKEISLRRLYVGSPEGRIKDQVEIPVARIYRKEKPQLT